MIFLLVLNLVNLLACLITQQQKLTIENMKKIS